MVLTLIGLLLITAFVLLRIYRNDIRKGITENIKRDLGLELQMEPAQFSLFSTWPQFSIRFRNVSVTSGIYKGPKESFLEAGNIYVSINMRKLLFSKELSIKQISINNAKIKLKVNADSSRNFEFIKPKPDTTSGESSFTFDLEKVTLKNVSFSFINNLKPQNFEVTVKEIKIKLRKYGGDLFADLKGQLKMGGLAFKRRKGPFFKNANASLDLKLSYFTKDKILTVLPPSQANINGEVYRVNAQLNQNQKRLYILAASDNAYLHRVAPLLNDKIKKILANFHVEQPLTASALIGIPLGEKQDPILVIRASTENNNLSIGESKVRYTQLSLTGKIYSITQDLKYGKEEEGLIQFSPVKGNIMGLPFTASVSLRGLQNSKLKVTAGVLIDSDKLEFDIVKKLHMKGNCLAQINYAGPAEKLNKKEFLGPEMSLRANLRFNDFYFQPRNSTNFFRLNGSTFLNGQDLSIKGLKVKTNGGELLLRGQVGNFTSYILGLNNYMRARLDLNSKQFDLSPYFGERKGPEKPKALSGKSNGKKQEEGRADNLDIQLKLTAEQLQAKGLKAYKALVLAEYHHQDLSLNDVQLSTCGGTFKAKGALKKMKYLSAEVDIRDVNVSTFLAQMNNFGQQAIRSDQLEGRLNLKGDFYAELDEHKKMMEPSMNGNVKLQLRDGRLMHFEPLKNISNYVFRNRDFTDITFTEINEKFYLKGQAMKIEEMEVASSVLNMFVSGVYNFTGNSVINVLVPWNNFKHRDKDYVAKSSGVSAEDTKGIKLNFSGPPKKMKMGVGYKKVEF